MLIFRIDESNFDGGERTGLRIATGLGLKIDFDEHAPDADTLGLWHLHDGACGGEGSGLEDASGGGRDLVNHGAEPVEDGYRVVRAESDYMEAAFAGQPARDRLTVEAWVRDWGGATGEVGMIAGFRRDGDNLLDVRAARGADPAQSYVALRLRVAPFGSIGQVTWQGAAADELLASPEPWHVAGVLDATDGTLRLFVGGVLRGTDSAGIVALPPGDYALRLGVYVPGWDGWDLSAVLDEVRLSSAARYAADFTPHRLLAAGTYDGPTFDAARLGADWVDVVAAETVPAGCGLAYEIRGADELDAFGEPQTLWEPYGGDPAELPDARYVQWRVMLSADGDRLMSPALASVEAHASEAGYNLYRGTGPGPSSIDYGEPVVRVGPGRTQVATGPLDAEAVHWFGIRPVDGRGIVSPTTQREVRLELDAAGQPVADRPAGVIALDAAPIACGKVRLGWRWRAGVLGVLPEAFRIFGDGGSGTIDYDLPLGEVAWEEGARRYAWQSEPLAGGVEQGIAVRAVASGEVWDEQAAVVTVTPDAAVPGHVDQLEAEVTP